MRSTDPIEMQLPGRLHPTYADFSDRNIFQSLDAAGVHHYFEDQVTAEAFVSWLEQQPELKESFKTHPIAANYSFYYSYYGSYYVSLTSKQFNIIMGNGAFARLLSADEISLAYKKIDKDILNYQTWKDVLTAPGFKEEFNQRRLMDPNSWTNQHIIVSLLNQPDLPFELFEKIVSLCNVRIFNQNSGQLMKLAAEKQNTKTFSLLVQILSATALRKAVLNSFTLHLAAKNQKDEPFVKLIQRLPSNILHETAFQLDNTGKTALHYAAENQPKALFLALVKILKPEVLSVGMLKSNYYQILSKVLVSGESALFAAVLHQPKAFEYMINLVPTENLKKVLSEVNKDNRTLFGIIASRARYAATLQKILNRIEPLSLKNLNDLINYQDMHDAAESDDLQHFKLFSEIISKDQFKQLCDKDIISIIAKDELTDKAEIALQYVDSDILYNKCRFNWINGFDIKFKAGLLQFLATNADIFTHKIHKDFQKYLSQDNPTNDSIKTADLTVIELDKIEENAAVIFETGLQSWHDIHLIKKYLRDVLTKTAQINDNQIQLHYIVNTLAQADTDTLLVGAKISYESYLAFPGVKEQLAVYQSVYRCIQAENGLIKIIEPENFNGFAQQLKDYSYRPKLRHERSESTITHKFVHLEDKIVPYESHKSNKKTKEYKGTKKQSTTLLDRKLVTPVFGQHDLERILVGVLFDLSKCLPTKAFFKYDRGTVDRGWVGSETEVKQYQAFLKDVFINNLSEAREFVRDNPTVMTEFLARLTRESCLAIIIARDTENARVEAKLLRDLFEKEINLKLPIVFYDNYSQIISVFSENSLLKQAQEKLKRNSLSHAVSNETNEENDLLLNKFKKFK